MDPFGCQGTKNVVGGWFSAFRMRTSFFFHLCQNVFNSANFTVEKANIGNPECLSQSSGSPLRTLWPQASHSAHLSLSFLSAQGMGSEYTFLHTHKTQKHKRLRVEMPLVIGCRRHSPEPEPTCLLVHSSQRTTQFQQLLTSLRWGQTAEKEPGALASPTLCFSGHDQHILHKIFLLKANIDSRLSEHVHTHFTRAVSLLFSYYLREGSQ